MGHLAFPSRVRRFSGRKVLITLMIDLGFLLVVFALVALGLNAMVYLSGRALIATRQDVRPAEAALILGARVDDMNVSAVLADRLDTAYDLYTDGKVSRLLVSGDHGTRDYDEVNAMRRYLLRKGVRGEDIFMDHAGFNTYNSMYRARHVFQVRRVIVVTQRFHLPRALWIAQRLGLEVLGVVADRRSYQGNCVNELREVAARVKAFFSVTFDAEPVFGGPVIPITGDGRKTWDQAE